MITIEWPQLFALSLYFLSFLSLSLLCGLYAAKKKLFPEKFLFIGSLLFGLIFNYFLFYLYTASFRMGHAVLFVFIGLGLLSIPLLARILLKDRKQLLMVWSYFAIPLLIIFALTATYGSLLYGCKSQNYVIDQWGEVQNPAFCHIAKLPIDNALPYIYGENVLNNRARSLVIDWSLADRPPLQIGTSLPLLDLTQSSTIYMRYAYYTVFSIFLQLSWVGVVWGVLHTLLKRRLHIWGLILALSATGFLYLNSIFVWPKLLAASLFVFGAFLLLWTNKKEKTTLSYKYLPVAAAAVSLALLSHTGVLFTLLALVPLFGYDVVRYHATLLNVAFFKKLGVAVGIALCLLVPWQVAKSQLITHDRLVKWHFAGVISAEDPRGTVETIVDEYQKLSLPDWVFAKRVNVETLLTGGVVDSCSHSLSTAFDNCSMEVWRNRVFFSSFYSLEFFAVGFVILAWQAIKRALDRFDKKVLLVYGLYLLIWIVALFLPGSTVLHQGSYASVLLLLLLLGRKIASLPDYLFITFVCLQVGLFILAWIVPFGFLS